MSTLRFQPEAERFYAEGHWRSGRPVGGLRRARRSGQPGTTALCSTTAP